MSWRTNRVVLLLRNVGRASGLNRHMAKLLGGEGYENRFQAEMLAAITPGSCVWDVGANVGLYSRQFSDIAGPTGRVFAFEPSPHNLRCLKEAVTSLENVTIVPVALGDREGVVAFEQGADALGATSRIVAGGAGKPSGKAIAVSLASGDHLIASGSVGIPNVIKIDTEGFELDVLRGLRQTLKNPSLRVLCIEVHFGLLEARGLPNAPADIEKLLAGAGFSIGWADASHIVATRVE
jgi:FkbM family methyltransferase